MQQGSNQVVVEWLVCSRFLPDELQHKSHHLIANQAIYLPEGEKLGLERS